MMTEKENIIQLKEENVLRFPVKDSKGNDLGVEIKFDLQDIELPLRINKCDAMHRKNLSMLRQSAMALDKKEDKKGKFLLSWKEEEKLKLLKDFYLKEEEAIDLLIGKGVTKKILEGLDRNYYYDMFDDIIGGLEPVLGKVENEANNLLKKIENKYKVSGVNENTI